MYRHVLVPIDPAHGEVGSHILRVARGLVDEGGRIRILTVLEPVPSYVANYLPPNVGEESRREARERLAALAAAAGIEAEIVLRTGHAPSEIIEEAREAGCDAIVLGSHRPDFRDYFIGSTAARVVRHAPVTVVVERSSQAKT